MNQQEAERLGLSVEKEWDWDFEGTPSSRLCPREQVILWQIQNKLDELLGDLPTGRWVAECQRIMDRVERLARDLP